METPASINFGNLCRALARIAVVQTRLHHFRFILRLSRVFSVPTIPTHTASAAAGSSVTRQFATECHRNLAKNVPDARERIEISIYIGFDEVPVRAGKLNHRLAKSSRQPPRVRIDVYT
jgi:hypothetical protein